VRARLILVLATVPLLAALAGCESFVEAEGPGAEDRVSADGPDESVRDMDDALCWQEIGSEPGDTSQNDQLLHDECMRGKGWQVDGE
jgi:hypothetical protein